MKAWHAIIGCAILAASCVRPQTRTEPVVSVGAVDFRGITSDGFFISPDPYIGDFEPLGLVFVTAQAGGWVQPPDEHSPYNHVDVGEMPIDSVVGLAKMRAVAMGADALVSVKLTVADRQIAFVNFYPVVAPGWQVSGLAIRRRR